MLSEKELFVSRDLSWLSFNERVLQEAKDHRNPLFERIKFLAIYSSNLDEFFKVKVSQLRQIRKIRKPLRKRLVLQPNKKLKEIHRVVKKQQEEFGNIFFKEIIPELVKNNIHLIDKDQFSPEHKAFSSEFFKEKLAAKVTLLKPMSKENVFLEDGKLYFALLLRNEEVVFVSIPTEEPGRFIELPAYNGTYYSTFVDEIIKDNISAIVASEEISEVYSVKLSRDAELYLDDEYDGVLAQQIYESLPQRKTGQATRLLYDTAMPKPMRKKVKEALGLGKVDMVPGGKYHNFSDFFAFQDPTANKDLHFESQEPVTHQGLNSAEDYFKIIAGKDQLVHFPYQSFEYVQQFIELAANDPKVKTIKISLYRVARQSHLTDALLRAVENGKEVVIFIEAQARFDEENNIIWGRTFEEKGARVYYSIPNIKVHSKILLIEREEEKKLKAYAYIGTGNFNAKTAKIYCDHGLFTANKDITNDLKSVFDFLERKADHPDTKTLLVSPLNSRKRFTALIDNEIENASKGLRARITAKMNSLQDKEMILKLYEASQAGVEIRLLIRGFCCLRPGVKDLSDNIEVSSIVDRYLEHGRIFLFENNGNEKMYMGSADWMTRNLDRRIEVITPILDKDVFTELRGILFIQLNDTFKSRIIDDEQSNLYISPLKKSQALRSQYKIFDYLKAL
ncbi:polyphosphate kinase 1 [Leptobacterium flavescens]|uniref:Polyphosphate kinase n=1 Tax=Leptobacterium flavescens TaxID=472055 RepID=A0A6P0UJN6_9FLAO|nr:polyphosphate kinase 1 [Leptobacterium flavescens]NER13424.1 polyphosphate kinase 1 [Leptobacterium flavescens]